MATLTTIAKEAGFSVSTTAKILQADDKSKFAEATRRKVLDTARRMNYRPNVAARSMKSRRTNCMALLIRHGNNPSAPTNPSGLTYLLGIQEVLAEHNTHLILVTVEDFDAKKTSEMPLVFREHLVDGLIVEFGVPEKIENLIMRSEEPVVWLDTARQTNMDCIFPLERDNVGEAIRHLKNRGFKRIIYVGNTESSSHYTSKLRYDSYLEYMDKFGLKPDLWQLNNHVHGDNTGDILRKHLHKMESDTVLLAYDTNYAQHLSNAASMMSIRIPDDVSIFTMDLDKMRLGRWPFFAGVSFDRKAMGREAGLMLLNKVSKGNPLVPSRGFKGVIEEGASCRGGNV